MSQATKEPALPAILYVLAIEGTPGQPYEEWRVGEPVPGSDRLHGAFIDDQGNELPAQEGRHALFVAEMNPSDDGGVDVFALPANGSKLHRQKGGTVINHPAAVVRRKMTIVDGGLWHHMRVTTKENIADEHVASLAAKWTGLPADMILDALADIREELEEGEPDSTPVPVVPQSPSLPAAASPPANGTGGAAS